MMNSTGTVVFELRKWSTRREDVHDHANYGLDIGEYSLTLEEKISKMCATWRLFVAKMQKKFTKKSIKLGKKSMCTQDKVSKKIFIKIDFMHLWNHQTMLTLMKMPTLVCHMPNTQ